MHTANNGSFKKGSVPWNKGTVGVSPGYWKNKKRPDISGENHYAFGKHRPEISEENNYLWKGGNVGYIALHTWVKRNLGKPTTRSMCGKTGLTKQKIHWANVDHRYKRDVKDWIRLCASCHKIYDFDNHLSNIGSRGGSIVNRDVNLEVKYVRH